MKVASSDPRWKAAGLFNNPMSDLVEQVDVWTEARQACDKASQALDKIEKLVKSDPEGDIAALSGMNAYAPQQHIDHMRGLFDKGRKLAEQIEAAYDDMNSAYFRMGLK